ncbi:MAG TPA: proline racemase family protein [Vicinamibacterales bacterium]|nr:proline racemase family protein [Vicinamibacterales bacterium]
MSRKKSSLRYNSDNRTALRGGTSRPSRQVIRTIDAHAAGGSVRLIVDGFPSPPGRTMLEKRDWLVSHTDHWRRALMLEPRGYTDLCGALFTEPVSPGSHAGLLFMNSHGYATMSGHTVIAALTIALERGLIMPGGDGREVNVDTPAGTIRARATIVSEEGREGRGRVGRLAFVNVPSFVVHAGLPVSVGQKSIRADVAFGGAFYAVVDSEMMGLPIDGLHLPQLRRAGVEIARAIETAHHVSHPLEPMLRGIEGTIFTAPPHDEQSALRNVTISASAQADRSPGGTSTAAVMAIVDAMGLMTADTSFTHEGIIGTRFTGRIVGRTTVGDYSAIVPEIEGSAWITGEHAFFMDESDPLKEGFRL